MRRSPFSAPVRSSSVPSGGYTATRLLSKSAGVISLESQNHVKGNHPMHAYLAADTALQGSNRQRLRPRHLQRTWNHSVIRRQSSQTPAG